MSYLRSVTGVLLCFAALAPQACGGTEEPSTPLPSSSSSSGASTSSGTPANTSSSSSSSGGSSSSSSGAPEEPFVVTNESVQDATGRTHAFVQLIPRVRAQATLPIVLVYHGDGEDGASLRNYFRFENTSGNQAIVLYPSQPGGWQVGTQGSDNPYLAGFDAIVDKVVAEQSGDAANVNVFGWSNGGFMGHLIGCWRSARVHTLTTMAGGYLWEGDPWPGTIFPRCAGQGPVRALVIHGENDDIGGKDWPARAWTHVNKCAANPDGCTGNGDARAPASRPPCQRMTDAPASHPVELCSIPNMGHQIWSEAAAATWDFINAP